MCPAGQRNLTKLTLIYKNQFSGSPIFSQPYGDVVAASFKPFWWDCIFGEYERTNYRYVFFYKHKKVFIFVIYVLVRKNYNNIIIMSFGLVLQLFEVAAMSVNCNPCL